jgi:ElaB/YqjD/DUF883 family membrane-anchored ribosome-binding protein
MSTAKTSKASNARQQLEQSAEEITKDAQQITQDLVQCLTDYTRQNPGTAALCCLGIGFVLGWKLKPW